MSVCPPIAPVAPSTLSEGTCRRCKSRAHRLAALCRLSPPRSPPAGRGCSQRRPCMQTGSFRCSRAQGLPQHFGSMIPISSASGTSDAQAGGVEQQVTEGVSPLPVKFRRPHLRMRLVAGVPKQRPELSPDDLPRARSAGYRHRLMATPVSLCSEEMEAHIGVTAAVMAPVVEVALNRFVRSVALRWRRLSVRLPASAREKRAEASPGRSVAAGSGGDLRQSRTGQGRRSSRKAPGAGWRPCRGI